MSEVKVDILAELRKRSGMAFMSRSWKPVLANKDALDLTLTHLPLLYSRSSRIRNVVDAISRSKMIPRVEIQQKVIDYLEEMGHYRNMSVIRWVGLILCNLIKKNYSGILVNEQVVNRVKALMGSHPVIFVPTHKSYADFILMSFLCYYYDIQIPVVAAGEDFRKMWLMGRILRECCAFFIKRSFSGDDLYKAVIAEYVNLMLCDGNSAFEFFIEGTRSRSGKSLMPKFGMMTMALEPYFLGNVPDITIVPITISYERVLEDQLFARELLGIPKPRESTMLLLRALQLLNENYGRIFVDFAEPISIKKFCSPTDIRIGMNISHGSSWNPDYPTRAISDCVYNLCFDIIKSHTRHLTFTPFNMLAVSMSTWMCFDSKVPFERVKCDIKFVNKIVLQLGYSSVLSRPVEEEMLECLQLHKRIIYQDSKDNSLKLHLGLASGATTQKDDKMLSDKTLSQAFPAVLIQEYANPVCFVVINVSILNMIFATTPYHMQKAKLEIVDLLAEYRIWRDILSIEFVLKEDQDQIDSDFFQAIHTMECFGIFIKSYDRKEVELSFQNDERNEFEEAILLGVLHPYICAYWMAIEAFIMIATHNKSVPEKDMKYIIQKEVENKISVGVPKSILSLDIIGNAVQSFSNLGALEKWNNGDAVMIRPVREKCKYYKEILEPKLHALEFQLSKCYEADQSLKKLPGSKL